MPKTEVNHCLTASYNLDYVSSGLTLPSLPQTRQGYKCWNAFYVYLLGLARFSVPLLLAGGLLRPIFTKLSI